MRAHRVLILVALAVGLAPETAFGQAAASATQKAASPCTTGQIKAELSSVKRISVESFGNDAASRQLQAMVIDKLVESNRFIVAENDEKGGKSDEGGVALRGSGTEQTSHEFHSMNENTSVGGASVGAAAAVARRMGVGDSQSSSETVNHARLSVRLVAHGGACESVVLWATAKESTGGKYEGADADVAAQVVKQLLWDLGRAQSKTGQAEPRP
jgi:ABC-type amino acid transport substrate-binding protein